MASYQIYLLTPGGEVLRAIEFDCADDYEIVQVAVRLRGTDELEVEIWHRTRLVRWLPMPPQLQTGLIGKKSRYWSP